MTKQEKIGLEAERHIRACLKVSGIKKDISNSLSKSLMVLLDGLGVAIKVERELPKCPIIMEDGLSTVIADFRQHSIRQYHYTQSIMLKAGFEATIPLIEGGANPPMAE